MTGTAQDSGHTGPIISELDGSPEINAYTPNAQIPAGDSSTVTVQVTNSGEVDDPQSPFADRVTTARNTTVSVDDSDVPLTVDTGETPMGALPTGQVRDLPLQITVPEGTEPGTYTIPAEFEYDYSEVYENAESAEPEIYSESTETETVERDLTITVEEAPQFVVSDVESDVFIGGTGTTEVTLENVGSDITDVTLTPTQNPSVVSTAASAPSPVFVSDWKSGEEVTLAMETRADAAAVQQPYQLPISVEYVGPDGTQGATEERAISVIPEAEQEFGVTIDSTLRVSDEGDLNVTVQNTGSQAAEDAILSLSTDDSALTLRKSQIPLETLAPDEETTVTVPAETSAEVEAGRHVLDAHLTYEANGETFEATPSKPVFTLGAEQDTFRVEASEEVTLESGGSQTITVDVTNIDDEPVHDIDSSFSTRGPISVEQEQSYFETLAPGETKSIAVDVSAEGAATPNTYPLKTDFQYETESGTTQLSDVHRLPVDVTEPDTSDSGMNPLVIGGGLVLVGLGGYYAYRRRTGDESETDQTAATQG